MSASLECPGNRLY